MRVIQTVCCICPATSSLEAAHLDNVLHLPRQKQLEAAHPASVLHLPGAGGAHLTDVAQQQPHKVVPAPAPEHLVVQEIMGQPPCKGTSVCEHQLPHSAAARCLLMRWSDAFEPRSPEGPAF